MRLILILIALTIALPVSISQAAQLLTAQNEAETVEAKTVKSSSVKAANDLMRADAEPWVSSRMRGTTVKAPKGEAVGRVESLLMNGNDVTAVKLVHPQRQPVLLPYALFEPSRSGKTPVLKLAVPLEDALEEGAVVALSEATARLGRKSRANASPAS